MIHPIYIKELCILLICLYTACVIVVNTIYFGEGVVDRQHVAHIVFTPGEKMPRLVTTNDGFSERESSLSLMIISDSSYLPDIDVLYAPVFSKYSASLSHVSPDTGYRFYAHHSEKCGHNNVHWSVLRGTTDQSILIDRLDFINEWITAHLKNSKSVVLCCVQGDNQCNSMTAFYIMYRSCWHIKHVREYLVNTLYRKDITALYDVDLDAYAKHLSKTKC